MHTCALTITFHSPVSNLVYGLEEEGGASGGAKGGCHGLHCLFLHGLSGQELLS